MRGLRIVGDRHDDVDHSRNAFHRLRAWTEAIANISSKNHLRSASLYILYLYRFAKCRSGGSGTINVQQLRVIYVTIPVELLHAMSPFFPRRRPHSSHATSLGPELFADSSFLLAKLCVCCFPNFQAFPQFRMAFKESTSCFTPNGFSSLQRQLKDESRGLGLRPALALLRLSQHDPDVFYKFKQASATQAPSRLVYRV